MQIHNFFLCLEGLSLDFTDTKINSSGQCIRGLF